MIYLPETSVVKFKTSERLDVPPVSVEFSIRSFECSSLQLEAMPASFKAFIKPSTVIVLSTVIVRSSPLTLKIAVPVPDKPKFSKVVVFVALIVFTTVCLKALVFE